MAVTRLTFPADAIICKLGGEAACEAIALKAKVDRVMALVNAVTDDGNTQANLEAATPDLGALAGLKAGQGHAYYVALAALKTALDTLPLSTLAQIETGLAWA